MDTGTYILIGSASAFGVIVATVVVLAIVLYRRRRKQEKLRELQAREKEKSVPPEPPEDDYPPFPPKANELVLVPPIVAPLPPVDYAIEVPDDGRPLETPEAYVIPIEPDLRPIPRPKPPEPMKLIIKKRKKKKPESSSESSESSDSDSSSEYHHHQPPVIVVPVMPAPVPAPQGITYFKAPAAPRVYETQQKEAEVAEVQWTPCSLVHARDAPHFEKRGMY